MTHPSLGHWSNKTSIQHFMGQKCWRPDGYCVISGPNIGSIGLDCSLWSCSWSPSVTLGSFPSPFPSWPLLSAGHSQDLVLASPLLSFPCHLISPHGFQSHHNGTIGKCAPEPLPYIPDTSGQLPTRHLHRKGFTPNWPLQPPFLSPGRLLPCLCPRRKANGASILSMGPAINLESCLMDFFPFHSMCNPRADPVNLPFNPYRFRTDRFSVSLLPPSKPRPPCYLAVGAS